MKEVKTPKGTVLPISDIKGKDYLEVKYRILWFNEVHPDWSIETTIDYTEETCLAKATIKDELGRIRATGHKYETIKGFHDHIEKSETGAIGRALVLIGFGTAFAIELDEGDRIVDAPVAHKKVLSTFSPPSQEPEPLKKGYFDINSQRNIDPRGFPHGDYPPPKGVLTDKQLQLLRFRAKQKNIPAEEYLNMIVAMGVENDADIPFSKVNDALGWLDSYREKK